jgi:peroxiredoxin
MRMHAVRLTAWTGTLLGVVAVFCCGAAEPTPQETLWREYETLGKEYRAGVRRFEQAYRAAPTDAERARISRQEQREKQKFVERHLDLAGKDPSSPIAVYSLLFVAHHAPEGKALDTALVRLRGHVERLDAELLAAVGMRLCRVQSAEAEKLLRAVREKSSHRDARGVATFDLARLLKNKGGGRAKEADKLFQEVIDRYADVDGNRGGLGKAAAAELFEVRRLGVGKTAPEIEGKDGDGKHFKLSDYRGKVVVLDFWGHWCAPCRATYPHHRALVKRLANRPFALLGINNDTPEDLKKALQTANITWRFWRDGGKDGGRIGKQWNVHSWPMIYVLDHRGVIRFKNVRGKALDEAVDGLLAAVPKPDQPRKP